MVLKTTEVKFSKNLSAEISDGESCLLPFKVYAHNLTITFTKSDNNTWDYKITSDDGSIGNNTGTIKFATDGTYDSANSTVKNPVTFTPGTGAADVEFTVDFSGITQDAKETNIDMTYQDGYTAGTLTGITVDTSGVITGIFDNGRSWPLAQVAIANFDNPAGLIKAGQNMYRSSNNSGEPQIGESGTGGRGTIAPGYLEMSNVDLSEEFTQMIITQRGFQANSRIITTSDEMLQELINIKR